MTEALQLFNPTSLITLLFGVILAWLVWPLICGILGAGRGQTGRGIMHGLMWGPIGIPIILMARRKHVCPTCGQRTLRDSPSDLPRAVANPPTARPAGLPEHIEQPPPPAAQSAPPVVRDPRPPEPLPTGDRERLIREAAAGYSEEDVARLRAWVTQS